MRDPLLEYTILRSLSSSVDIAQFALACEVDVLCGHHEITYDFFVENLMRLKTLGLINSSKDLLDYTRWTITEKGRDALKEFSLANKEKL